VVLSNGGFEKGNLTESANNVMGSYPWFTSNSGGNTIAVTREQTRSGSYSLGWNPIGWNIREDNLLGMSWLSPTDWPYEATKKALQGYLDAAALQHEPFMKYLTSLGLKYEDGTEKPGYAAFKSGIVQYRKAKAQPRK
jgi:hypothetical protein